MNREIKFRVFNPQEKQMTNVRLCDYVGFHGIVYDRVGCNNSDNIWMQYTGLKDANGKDIYEGDIVTDVHYFMEKKDVVTWVDCGWSTKNSENWEYKGFEEIALRGRFEVIGNIYENPELL